MYNVTNDYKRDIFVASRLFNIEVKIGNNTFTKNEVTTVKFEGGVQPRDSFELGTVVATTAKIELRTNKPISENEKIEIRIALWVERKVNDEIIHEWEWVPMGAFFIDEFEEPERGTVLITACDAVIKTEVAFTGKGYTTLLDVARLITKQTGISFADTVPSEKVEPLKTDYTVRGVLSLIASMMGGFMTVNREGQFKVVQPLSNPVMNINGDNYFTNKPEKTSFAIGKITCITDTTDDGKRVQLVSGTLSQGTKEIQFENPWMSQRILDQILNRYSDFVYSGYTLDLQGNPALESCDTVKLTDISGVVYDLPVLWWTLEFNGGVSETISAKGATELRNSFESKGSGQKELEKVVAQQGVFNEIVTETLTAHSGLFEDIKAGTGEFDKLYVKYTEFGTMIGEDLTVKELLAGYGKIEIFESDIANIKELIGGNLTMDNIHSLILTSDKVTIDKLFVKNEIAANILVADLAAGTISTNQQKIMSDDGAILIDGPTQQFKDENGKVRLQIGRDAYGHFNFILIGEDANKGAIIDQDGIHTGAVPDGLIVDIMINNNANISGNKINIPSLVTEINGSKTTIKSSVIAYDDTGQTLNVLFGQLITDTEELKDTTQSLSTELNLQSGEIEGLISDSTIVNSEGTTIKLKDAYAALKLTVNGLDSTVKEHTSQFGQYVTTETYTSGIKQVKDEITSSVSQTYAKKDDLGDLVTTAELASEIKQTQEAINLSVSQNYTTKDSYKGLEKRVSSAELKLTDKAITLAVNNGLNAGNAITTTKMVLDNSGLTIKNGGFRINNNNDVTVLSQDTLGNLIMDGSINMEGYLRANGAIIQQFLVDPTTGVYQLAIKEGAIRYQRVYGQLQPTTEILSEIAFSKSYGGTGDPMVYFSSKGKDMGLGTWDNDAGRPEIFISSGNVRIQGSFSASNAWIGGYTQSNDIARFTGRLSQNYIEVAFHAVGVNPYGISIWESDARLKNNIEETDIKGIETVKGLQHRQFDWLDGRGHVGIGYVSQELMEIYPEMAFKVGDGEGALYQPKESVILPIVSKALQETIYRDDTQDEEIRNLKKQIADLQQRLADSEMTKVA